MRGVHDSQLRFVSEHSPQPHPLRLVSKILTVIYTLTVSPSKAQGEGLGATATRSSHLCAVTCLATALNAFLCPPLPSPRNAPTSPQQWCACAHASCGAAPGSYQAIPVSARCFVLEAEVTIKLTASSGPHPAADPSARQPGQTIKVSFPHHLQAWRTEAHSGVWTVVGDARLEESAVEAGANDVPARAREVRSCRRSAAAGGFDSNRRRTWVPTSAFWRVVTKPLSIAIGDDLVRLISTK